MKQRSEADMIPKNRLIKLLNDGRSPYFDHGKYLLSWNVKVHTWPSAENILDSLAKHFYRNRAELLIRFPESQALAEKHAEADMFDRVTSDMRDSLSDTDSYRMYRPKFAKKYGLAYKGKGAEKPFDVTFSFYGRNGGHLVIEEFEGMRMKDFDYDDWYPDQWTRQLCAMIEEWDLCFTKESIYAECGYLLAWTINLELEGLEEAA
jgi:hypothetical protein